jgi:hypothetical protein
MEDDEGDVIDLKVGKKHVTQAKPDRDLQASAYLTGRRAEGWPAGRFRFQSVTTKPPRSATGRCPLRTAGGAHSRCARSGRTAREAARLVTGMMNADKIITITMTATEVIDQVAERAEIEPEVVERVIEAVTESIQRAAERHEQIGLATEGGRAHVLTALMLALVAAEREGGLDASTASSLRALRNLIAHARAPEQLIEALMPAAVDVPTPAAVLQARRNAEARTALLREFGALRSHQVAELARSRASNRAALANRWRAEQRVLAVPVADELLYPGFQFTEEGRPHPAVSPVLMALRSETSVSDWQAALWFVGANGWLGGRRPVDLLDEEPQAVVEAARREVEELVF